MVDDDDDEDDDDDDDDNGDMYWCKQMQKRRGSKVQDDEDEEVLKYIKVKPENQVVKLGEYSSLKHVAHSFLTYAECVCLFI